MQSHRLVTALVTEMGDMIFVRAAWGMHGVCTGFTASFRVSNVSGFLVHMSRSSPHCPSASSFSIVFPCHMFSPNWLPSCSFSCFFRFPSIRTSLPQPPPTKTLHFQPPEWEPPKPAPTPRGVTRRRPHVTAPPSPSDKARRYTGGVSFLPALVELGGAPFEDHDIPLDPPVVTMPCPRVARAPRHPRVPSPTRGSEGKSREEQLGRRRFDGTPQSQPFPIPGSSN